jgi:hypothetical protein
MRTVKHTDSAGRWCLAGANGFVQWMLQVVDGLDIEAEFVERKRYTTTAERAHCTEWLFCLVCAALRIAGSISNWLFTPPSMEHASCLEGPPFVEVLWRQSSTEVPGIHTNDTRPPEPSSSAGKWTTDAGCWLSAVWLAACLEEAGCR